MLDKQYREYGDDAESVRVRCPGPPDGRPNKTLSRARSLSPSLAQHRAQVRLCTELPTPPPPPPPPPPPLAPSLSVTLSGLGDPRLAVERASMGCGMAAGGFRCRIAVVPNPEIGFRPL